ncbi:hypothetical protein PENTCL1PPCAC_30540, partial [Pristionchus entomophagus]
FVVYDNTEDCQARHDIVLHAIQSVLNAVSSACKDQQTTDSGCYILMMTTCDDLDFAPGQLFVVAEAIEMEMVFNFTIDIRSSDTSLTSRIFDAIWAILDRDHSYLNMYPTDYICADDFPIHVHEEGHEYCSQTSPGTHNDNGEIKECPIGTYS